MRVISYVYFINVPSNLVRINTPTRLFSRKSEGLIEDLWEDLEKI